MSAVHHGGPASPAEPLLALLAVLADWFRTVCRWIDRHAADLLVWSTAFVGGVTGGGCVAIVLWMVIRS